MADRYTSLVILAIAVGLVSLSAHAQWVQISAGIEYQKFTLSDPNDVFVARMDRANTGVTIDSILGQGKLDDNARETVSSMAARRGGSLGYWGENWDGFLSDVKVVINGDFWDTSLGMPQSGHIQSGWYAKRFDNVTGGSGFVWTLNRGAFIGGCITHVSNRNTIRYPGSGVEQEIDAINLPRVGNELTLYTPQWNVNTGTVGGGIEVVVRLERPAMILPKPSFARGNVTQIADGLNGVPIPFDCVVLSATGNAATILSANVSVGSEIRISQEIRHLTPDCSTGGQPDWTKAYASVGGSFDFLRGGVIDPHSHDAGATNRNPRTAVAINNDYIFFLVVDGRRTGSIGMSMQELGEFCRDTLGATDATNQDGGGSSAMWVDGAIVNQPSDGTERATHNGVMMANLVVPGRSTATSNGETHETIGATSLRQGPGTNFNAYTGVSSGTEGTIVNHSLNGIEATGEFWWLVEIAGTEGWIAESALIPKSTESNLSVFY